MFKLAYYVLLIFVICKVRTSNASDKNSTMVYLTHYGYMKTNNESIYKEGLKMFQKQTGINMTGEMDEQTQKVMEMPRCGSDQPEVLRGLFHGSRWKTRKITYKILDYPQNISEEKVDETIARAFNEWSKHINFNFTRVFKTKALMNITFKYVPKMKSIGPVVGTGKYPIHGGHIYFSSETKWIVDWEANNSNYTSLYHVALHEIGHTLGLLHSSYPNSIMSPMLDSTMDSVQLHPNDKKRLKVLYGENLISYKFARNWTICELTKLDAIINYAENEVYVFNKDEYWLVEAWTDNVTFTYDYPKKISEKWKELPSPIDTAYVNENGTTFFFKGSLCWKYVEKTKLVPGYPREISVEFPGIPHDLDAVTLWENNCTYFFQGGQYWKFDRYENPSVATTYPKSVSLWGNVPVDMDAVLYFQYYNYKTYFFKDMLYYRYLEPGEYVIRSFPRHTASWWFNC